GVTDLGTLEPRGFGQPGRPTPEIFFDGEPLELARWPNKGFVEAGEIIEETDDGAVFTFEGDRPATWAEPGKVWMFGYWYHHWADGTLAVADIDGENQRITTDGLPNYGVREGQHYHYFNILEELERPGEWYLDRDTGILYLYPPSDIEEATVEFSVLEDAMVTLDNTAHIGLEGLTLDVSRGSGVEINGGEHNLVAGCTISRMAQDGVEINGGTGHGVVGSDLFTLGRGGTDVTGGDRATLEPGEHFIENNEVRDFSRLDRTYTPAVRMGGAGNRIAHNLFHDTPHHAIRLDGNDHVVEFNEVHSVVYESDDQAGLDMFFNPAYRGNVIRYNFWHHIGSGLDRHGQSGVRLDDAISGVRVYGNVFLHSARGMFGAIQIHGGKENVLDGNLFIECDAVLSFSAWGESRWLDFLERSNVVQALTETVNIHEPPYSERYPELAELEENPDMNFFWRNAAVECGELLLRAPDNQVIMDNWTGAVDPGFADREARDFSLAGDAMLYGLTGMEPIPFGHIGPHDDEYRARWPIEHEISENYMALDPE
ncbi:MAG: right-handed parallel beta-helix repeat-containing protein, partial [Candidatus Hydrogenedentota bacterium]